MRLVGSQGLRGSSRERPFRSSRREASRAARAENEERSGASNKIVRMDWKNDDGEMRGKPVEAAKS